MTSHSSTLVYVYVYVYAYAGVHARVYAYVYADVRVCVYVYAYAACTPESVTGGACVRRGGGRNRLRSSVGKSCLRVVSVPSHSDSDAFSFVFRSPLLCASEGVAGTVFHSLIFDITSC